MVGRKSTFTNHNGRKYVGDWVHDKCTGHGVLTWPNGDTYDGDWLEDKRHGQGTKVGADGSQYIGSWVHDKRSGQGFTTWPNGDEYEGTFFNTMAHGKGKKTWADGSWYDGDWGCDKRTGHGTFKLANGDVNDGDWVNDKRHDKGTWTSVDGCNYTGVWVDGTSTQQIFDSPQFFCSIESCFIATHENAYFVRENSALGTKIFKGAMKQFNDSQPVVIKMLAIPLGLDSNEQAKVQEQFAQEAKVLVHIARQFEHVVQVHHFLTNFHLHGQHNMLLIMEHCELGNLYDYIRHHKLGSRDKHHIICQLLTAYRDIHSNGVLHRDVRPENILLCRRSNGLIVKLCDFSVSKSRSSSEHITPQSNRAPTSFPDPAHFVAVKAEVECWAAPEVLEQVESGDHLTYSNKSDIWSLGCVIYFIATDGKVLITRDTEALDASALDWETKSNQLFDNHGGAAVDPYLRHMISLMVQRKQVRFSLENLFLHPYVLSAHATTIFLHRISQ